MGEQTGRRGAPLGNVNRAIGYPKRRNYDRYPDTDGRALVCDQCHAQRRCPKFEPGMVCAYRPEFRDLQTRDLDGVVGELQQLAQAQKQRVAFGLMVENLMLGGQVDRQVSQAIDRQVATLALLARLLEVQQGKGGGEVHQGGFFDKLFTATQPEDFFDQERP